MIYDFTIYRNEDHLLKLKMDEELNHIDKLVVVEMDRTFQNDAKPRNFPPDYCLNDKVDYHWVICNETVKSYVYPKERELYQREYARVRYDFKLGDIVIVTDIDEIIAGDEIDRIAEATLKHKLVGLNMPCYYYYLNAYRCEWCKPFATIGKLARLHNFTDLRCRVSKIPGFESFPRFTVLDIKGGHFSYLGKPQDIADKIKSITQFQYNIDEFTDPEKIQHRMNNLEDIFDRVDDGGNILKLKKVDINGRYPDSIKANWDFWKEYAI